MISTLKRWFIKQSCYGARKCNLQSLNALCERHADKHQTPQRYRSIVQELPPLTCIRAIVTSVRPPRRVNLVAQYAAAVQWRHPRRPNLATESWIRTAAANIITIVIENRLSKQVWSNEVGRTVLGDMPLKLASVTEPPYRILISYKFPS